MQELVDNGVIGQMDVEELIAGGIIPPPGGQGLAAFSLALPDDSQASGPDNGDNGKSAAGKDYVKTGLGGALAGDTDKPSFVGGPGGKPGAPNASGSGGGSGSTDKLFSFSGGPGGGGGGVLKPQDVVGAGDPAAAKGQAPPDVLKETKGKGGASVPHDGHDKIPLPGSTNNNGHGGGS